MVTISIHDKDIDVYIIAGFDTFQFEKFCKSSTLTHLGATDVQHSLVCN